MNDNNLYEVTPGILWVARQPDVQEVDVDMPVPVIPIEPRTVPARRPAPVQPAPARPAVKIPVAVAVARSVGSPVDWAKVVNAPAPERFTWAIFQPITLPDPAFPVPVVDLGDYYFSAVRPFGKHYLDFRTFNQRPREWAAISDGLLEDASTKLRRMVVPTPEQCRLVEHTITEEEYAWLMGALWQVYAEPRGYPAIVRDFVGETSRRAEWDRAPDDWAAAVQALRLENEKKEAEAREAKEKARLKRDRQAHELAYGGDGISIDYGS